jgi:hypothetical protein
MVNTPGLTDLGKAAIREMMRQGMMVDIDHMSQASVDDALSVAEAEHFPVNSGHNSIRGLNGDERALTAAQYTRIGKLHGMAGIGVAKTHDTDWLTNYRGVAAAMGRTAGIGFGTDANGMSPLMQPPVARRFDYTNDFKKSTLDGSSWDYNLVGVAHYGMLADFLHGLPALDGGAAVVADLQTGAQYFFDTWKLVEAYRDGHAAGGTPASASATTASVATGKALALGLDAGAPPGTPSRRLCPDQKEPDAWGICVRKGAVKGAGMTAKASAPAPLRKPASESTLKPGAYTLILATGGTSANEHAGFSVDITVAGRRITLRPLGAKPGAKTPRATGGFRHDHFVMRLDADDQVLVLNAPSGPGALNDVRGGFVAHTPGKKGVSGTFVLKETSTLSRPPKGAKAYAELRGFLAGLHSVQ